MLRNVVSDHVSLRDSFLKSQLMDDILELINISLQAKKISTIKTSLFLLYDCLKHENINLEDVKLVNSIYKMFPIFENLIFINDDEVFICCLFSLKIISSVEDPTNQLKIQKMFLQNDGEIINLLLAINYNECKFELLETIRILGNLLSVEDNNFIDNLLEYDILKFFKSVFDNEKSKKMRRETIWAISNITGGSYKHIKTIVDSDLFEEIIKMTSDYDFSTRKEAVYALFNMCVDISLSLGTELVKKGIFEVFIKVIEKNVDNSIIELALESIDKILNTGEPLREIAGFNSMAKKFDEVGGINCLEQLQKHPNQKIYEKTLNILDKYYETKDVDHNVLDLDNQSANSGNNSSVIFNESNLNNIHSSNPNYNFFGPNGAVELQNGDRNSYPNQINSMHTNYQFR